MAAGATFDYIGSTVLSSRAVTLTVSSIPSTYTDLVCFLYGTFQNDVSTYSGSTNVYLQINGDTTTNSHNYIYNYGGTAAPGGSGGAGGGTYDGIYLTSGKNWHSHTYSADMIYVGDYASTSKHKTVLVRSMREAGSYPSAATNAGYFQWNSAVWRSTSAVTSIVATCADANRKFEIGTTLAVYGIAKA